MPTAALSALCAEARVTGGASGEPRHQGLTVADAPAAGSMRDGVCSRSYAVETDASAAREGGQGECCLDAYQSVGPGCGGRRPASAARTSLGSIWFSPVSATPRSSGRSLITRSNGCGRCGVRWIPRSLTGCGRCHPAYMPTTVRFWWELDRPRVAAPGDALIRERRVQVCAASTRLGYMAGVGLRGVAALSSRGHRYGSAAIAPSGSNGVALRRLIPTA